MAKRKKGHKMIYKTQYRKLQIEEHEPLAKSEVFWKGKQFLFYNLFSFI